MESDPPFQEKYKTLFANSTEVEGNSETLAERRKTALEEYELPLVDLSGLNLTHSDCRMQIAWAAKEWGIFQVVNHGISREILTRMHCEQVKLFRRTFEEKVKENSPNYLSSAGYYRWGTPAATSLKQFSWSEAFHIPLNNINLSKKFNATLSTIIAEFAEAFSEIAQRIAEILAENLRCRSNFFVENCLPSSCYLRMNRYPPCPISSAQIFGLVPHTDSDFLTILYQDQVGGLQMVKDGNWVNIKPNPEALVINIGDLFEAWSNGVYKSIEHRVVTNHEVERFSVGYFFCPSNETVVQGCKEPSKYRKFTFKEYRQQVQEDVKTTGSKIGLLRFLV